MRTPLSTATLVAAAVLAATATQATEGGGSIYPNGNENYLVGAVPPPGTYVLEYASVDHLTRLRGNQGERLGVPFDVKVAALGTRIVRVTDTKIFGGQLALHAIFPLLKVEANIAGQSDSRSGLGDIAFGPGLGYHDGNLHYAVAVDFNAPTGSYNKNRLANLGRNYWSVQPIFALSYIQASGINADLKLMYDINGNNSATNYRSGQELHLDYALGWGLGNGWVAGVGGYAYQQTTADRQNGATVADSKGRAMGFGPSIKYDNGKGFFITAKLQKDFGVRNRAEGTALKVKFSIPF